jgi:hypothetical protein
MSYLLGSFFSQHYYYYVEAKGPVLDVVAGKKIACRPEHSGLLGFGDNRLGRKVSPTGRWTEILVRPCLDFDKDKRPITIYHNQVDFTRLAGKVASESLKAFAF